MEYDQSPLPDLKGLKLVELMAIGKPRGVDLWMKNIDDFSDDDFKLNRAMRRAHRFERCKTQISRDFFLLLKELQKTSIGNVHGKLRVLGTYSPEFFQILNRHSVPLIGLQNVIFRCLIEGEVEKLIKHIHDPDNQEGDIIVWKDCLARFESVIERALGDIVVPPEPTTNDLGTFKVVSEILAVDPLYEPEVAHVLKASPGVWRASVLNFINVNGSYRCIELRVVLEGFEVIEDDWKFKGNRVSVDSGQAGFYCTSSYHDGDEESDSYQEFYNLACDSTWEGLLGDIHANGKGVTSRTGYGDGAYTLHTIENVEGKVCAARIVYLKVKNSGRRN